MRAGSRAELGSADFGEATVAEGARRARSLLLRVFGSRPRDVIALCVAVSGAAAVLMNALYLQPGPHPAPIFTIRPRPVGLANTTASVPRARQSDLAKTASGAGSQAEVIADVQRELERRGFYDGPIDGFHGPRTDAAVRDFEQTVGVQPAVEPSKELLQIILRSPARRPAASQLPMLQNSPASSRADAIGNLIASSSRRVLAVQRALGDFGYGPVQATGVLGPETRAAIEKFERDRKLPVTGQLTERLVRELTAVTGRPLE